MTTKLGSYVVPKDTDLAGRKSGEGDRGLHKNFSDTLNEMFETHKEEGHTRDSDGVQYQMYYGSSGFVEHDSAYSWKEDDGNGDFWDNITHFGWGVGQELWGTDEELAAEKDWINSKSDTYGVKCISTDSNHYFIVPSSFSENESVTDLQYTAATAATAAAGAATAASGSGTSIGAVSYFFSNSFVNAQQASESALLTGERALANDEPVWKTIKSAVGASLRTCTTTPDGKFIAWYPDYWGMYDNKTPSLELEDIELINLSISQSDSEFYSHVYCRGVDSNGTSVDWTWMSGVVSIESGMITDDNVGTDSTDTTGTSTSGATAVVPTTTSGSSSSDASSTDNASGTGSDSDTTTHSAASSDVAAIIKDMIYIPEGEEWKYSPKELYRRYGARPNTTPTLSGAASLIESNTSSTSASTTATAATGTSASTTNSSTTNNSTTTKTDSSTSSGSTSTSNSSNSTTGSTTNGGTSSSSTTSATTTGTSTSTDTDKNNPETSQVSILPFLYALYEFMYHWSNMYKADLEITFNPAIFPGFRIKVKSFDISFYVKSVTHNMAYDSSGFTTRVECTCPVGTLVSGMVDPKKDVGQTDSTTSTTS